MLSNLLGPAPQTINFGLVCTMKNFSMCLETAIVLLLVAQDVETCLFGLIKTLVLVLSSGGMMNQRTARSVQDLQTQNMLEVLAQLSLATYAIKVHKYD